MNKPHNYKKERNEALIADYKKMKKNKELSIIIKLVQKYQITSTRIYAILNLKAGGENQE